MTTIAARAHRILRRRQRRDGSWLGMDRFHDARDESEILDLISLEGEALIGFYENEPGVTPHRVFVTDVGLRFPGCDLAPVDFAAIAGVRGPADKVTGARVITVTMRDGAIRVVPITGRHGPEGKLSDAYEFVRFLMRVGDDQRTG